VTTQLLGLCVILLFCLGLLLGSSWTLQAVQPKLRRQAEERRKLDEEWSALRNAQRQWGTCPYCGNSLSGQGWYFTPTPVEKRPHADS